MAVRSAIARPPVIVEACLPVVPLVVWAVSWPAASIVLVVREDNGGGLPTGSRVVVVVPTTSPATLTV